MLCFAIWFLETCSRAVLPGHPKKGDILELQPCQQEMESHWLHNTASPCVFCVCPLDQHETEPPAQKGTRLGWCNFELISDIMAGHAKKMPVAVPTRATFEHTGMFCCWALEHICTHCVSAAFQSSYRNLFDVCNIQNAPVLFWILWAKFWSNPINITGIILGLHECN